MMSMRNAVHFALAFFVILVAAWFYTLAISSDYHVPGKRDIFFNYVAVTANVPELCDKISPKALVVAGFSSSGHRIYLNRSLCYFQTATRYSDPLLCLKVKSANNIFHWGYRISTLGCWKEMAGKGRSEPPIFADNQTILHMFEEMGYSIDQATTTLPIEPLTRPAKFFSSLYRQPDITQRLSKALASKEKIAVEDYELLADMLAKHTNDIKWCNEIRPGVRHPAEKKSETTWSLDFREYCIHQAAIGSGNESYCNELPDRPVTPGQPAIWWPANECRSELKHRKQSKGQKSASFHGYHRPEDEEQIVRLLSLLGYELPKDSTQSEHKLAQRYQSLFSDIGKGRIDRGDPRVVKLVQQLKRLEGSE